MRFLLFLSVSIYLLLIYSLSIYILNSKANVLIVKEYNKTIQDKNISDIKEFNKTISKITITHTKPIIKIKKDLVHINFNKRLQELDAKIGDPIFIQIFKKESMMEVWIKAKDIYEIFKKYPICTYSGNLGPKLKEGDGQAPEGFYKVTKQLLNPNSNYHLSFNLGYPNKYDKSHKRTGSYLMVHGECVSIGCYAMTNPRIEEIYKLVSKALYHKQRYVQVHIFPFYMNDENMVQYENNKWYTFWMELKEGYDYFLSEKLPPEIKVKKRHYKIFESIE